MMRNPARLRCFIATALLTCTSLASGQDSAAQRLDTGLPSARRDTIPLASTITLEAVHLRLGDALTAIADQADLGLIYGSAVVPVERRVSVRLRAASAEAALQTVLDGTGVDFVVAPSRQVVLFCQSSACRERMK